MPDPFGLFRSFLPFENPIGFGASDFLELGLAATLVCLILIRPAVEPRFRALAAKTGVCLLLLAVAPAALRLGLLAHQPVPLAAASDEFSTLLAADTLCHLRLANPAPPMPEFFKAPYILEQPVYGSVFPPGAAIPLALGRAVFGHPWAGIVLTVATLCAACYWMFRAWTTPAWALTGGALAVSAFGPLNGWMNDYRGGAFAALSGCLVFGALPRLARKAGVGAAAILGAGLAMALLARPYESMFLLASVILFCLPSFRSRIEWRPLARVAPIGAMFVLGAAGVLSIWSKQMTGSWTTMPALAGAYRGPSYRLIYLAPLAPAIAAFLFATRSYRAVWVLLTLALFVAGFFLTPRFQDAAMVSSLLLLTSVLGLQQLSRIAAGGREVSMILVFLCVFHFLFWYGVQYETWNGTGGPGMTRRTAIERRLSEAPGRQLVFVRYYRPGNEFQDEWVYNEPDFNSARVVRARDLGVVQNVKLRDYYRDRTAWLLEPDTNPPSLSAYQPEPPPATPENKAPEPAVKKPAAKKPLLQFEEVPQAR